MYELVVLDKSWIFGPDAATRFRVLSKVINKAYSKPMYRFGIVQLTRVKKPALFLSDFSLSANKDVFFTLLLIKEDYFQTLGISRLFEADVHPLEKCTSSDIAGTHADLFEPLTDANVEITYADENYIIDDSVANRVLSTLGFKTFSDNAEKSEIPEYEITCFTSFLRGIGPQLLNFLIEKFVSDPECAYLSNRSSQACMLHAVVIRDHLLVPYYVKNCEFVEYGKADLAISVSGENSPLEAGIVATKPFSLAFLRRKVDVK